MCDSRIFKAAIKLSPERRASYLDQACGTDEALRGEVESLLRANEEASGFLQSHPGRPLATVDSQPIAEGPGTMIGPYKLLQQIGEGGMGVVYMAEQEQPVRRKVAVKIVKSGLDSAQVIARFEAERQALALMDHPNIAKVLDAGTTESGRPYFVMELVKGIPITRFCDEHQLTPRHRLELFIPVCQAVQHAHQKGIIHRDLKPSNVLVALYDDQPVPKVIDFGVAKATSQKLTERTLFTAFGSFIGTLEYMSPEQAKLNALDIDTRSDVYALGVLLYELLTGNTPLEHERLKQTALDELLRIIREDEPPRPSTRLSYSGERLAAISAQRGTEPTKLGQVLRGELDWIVMRALEKERTRRYETANGLARDIQHYLADEPVEACPPSVSYKLRKFARKHKAGLATAVGFAVLLVLGTVVSSWQAVRATQAETVANASAVQAQEKEQEAKQQRDEAQRQRDEVKALNDKLAAKEQQLQRTLYAAHMNLAKHAWDDAAVHQVLELLEQHRPKAAETDLRGFEWYYLDRLCHSDLLTLRHSGRLYSVAFSPDGKRLASASRDKTVKVWDAQTGQELLEFKGHSDVVRSLAYSPNGKRLATASWDKTVKVWNAQTGQELLTFKGHSDQVRSVAFTPDGKRLASATYDGMVKVWDAQTGQELLTIKGGGSCMAFSPDGKRLATDLDYKTVKVWDAQTGQELFTFKGNTGMVMSVVFSPDGKRLASSGDRTVKVWDAQTGQELFTFKGNTGMVTSVAFSPDGTRLASATLNGIIKVWDATTSPEARTFSGLTGWVRCVAFSPDGKRLASGGGIWDETKKAYVAGGVNVLDAQTGQELLSIKGLTNPVSSVAFSPDGKRLASASQDGAVRVWDAQTGQKLLTCKGHTGQVTSVVFSPDGKRLASGSGTWDAAKNAPVAGEVKVWDAQTGQELLAFKEHSTRVFGLAFSPDGKRLASASEGLNGTLKVWDAQTGQELFSVNVLGGYPRVAFSPDGKRLASGSGAGPGALGEVKVWDAQTGKELLSLKGHTAVVSSVVFSPDGKRLASGSGNPTDGRMGEVKVWDAQTGQELLTLKGGRYGHDVAFSPNGHWLASDAGGTVKIYDATPLPEKPKP
jgi:WD40 repeat protein